LWRTVTHKTADCREKHSFDFRSLRAATDVHLQAQTLEEIIHALCAKFEVSPGAEEERTVAREHLRLKLKCGGTTFALGILPSRHTAQPRAELRLLNALGKGTRHMRHKHSRRSNAHPRD
jgi:hypothetical protein